MGVFAARFGPVIVYGAVVVAAQEGAGHRLEDIIALLVHPEITFHEYRWFYAQGGRDPPHIRVGDPGSEGAAAVGAIEAADRFEHRFMKGMHPLIEFPGIGGCEPLHQGRMLLPGSPGHRGQFVGCNHQVVLGLKAAAGIIS